MSEETPLVIDHTLHWLKSLVIEYNLCPFAKGAVNKNALRLVVFEKTKKALALEHLMTEIQLLDAQPTIETTLIIFPHAFKDFFTYLDFADLAEQLLVAQGYEGIYQLATFHPDYYFADTPPEEASNYSNRSPYPMVHILREEQLEKAIAAYKNTNEIPEKNKTLLNELGIEKIKEIIKFL